MILKPQYHENLQKLHVGCEEPRAYYVPYSNEVTATAGEDELEMHLDQGPETVSDRYHLLSGDDWYFGFYPNLREVPDDFFLTDNEEYTSWPFTPVPSCWQIEGYDRHQYVNTRYPIPYDPPFVPEENPVGAYVKFFDLDDFEETDRYYLNFEGVDSCFYVWLNDCFVGYSQVSHSTSEFDVTDYIEYNNKLSVLVLKWSDGTYLEDQDKLRMSGIFRDVYLLQRPEEHMRSFIIGSDYDAATGEGFFSFKPEWRNAAQAYELHLLTADGETIQQFEVEDGGDFEFTLDEVQPWTAELPYLYTLHILYNDECISEVVGFRRIEIEKGGILKINGQKIKFKGVNRHDSDPETGYTISREQLLTDLTLMKQFNVNALRTAHYPNAPWAYHFYDRVGLYVIDESDIETHGVLDLYGGGNYGKKSEDGLTIELEDYGYIANDPAFGEAMLDRIQRCATRDVNRPSVILWSMGNESGYGVNFEKAAAWLKHFDPTRLVHYEGSIYQSPGHENDYSNIDVFSRMYPSIPESTEILTSGALKDRPFVLCEYIHAMGNGPGDAEDYQKLIYAHDNCCGGFVWEWCDHAINMGMTVDGKTRYFYGGDWGEKLHDGNFCMDGLVTPDREPSLSLLEFSNVIRPARLTSTEEDLLAGKITIKNHLDFTDLEDYLTLQYSLNVNGEIKAYGELPCPSVGPWEECEIELPNWPDAMELSEGQVDFVLSYHRSEEDFFFDEGDLLGHDQLILSELVTPEFLEAFFLDRAHSDRATAYDEVEAFADSQAEEAAEAVEVEVVETDEESAEVELDETAIFDEGDGSDGYEDALLLEALGLEWEDLGHEIVIDGDHFRYVFCKARGAFSSMVYDQETLLTKPMEYNVWRAPTDNDRNIRRLWEQMGMDQVQTKVTAVEVGEVEQGLRIQAHVRLAAPSQTPVLSFDAIWTVETDGRVYVDFYVERYLDTPWLKRLQEEMEKKELGGVRDFVGIPWLPRFGLRLFLPERFDQFKYHGYGPYESYIDKRRASVKGTYEQSVDELYVNYLKPQEHGNRYGISALRIADSKRGTALCVWAPEGESETFEANASRYTQEELTQKQHAFELETAGDTVLCLDYKQAGIGSNSCGPVLMKEYRFDEMAFRFRLILDVMS